MKIVGLKVTHDSGISYIEDGVLKFSVEFEKVNNRKRYTKLENAQWAVDVFKAEGVDPEADVVVDGWRNGIAESPAMTIRVSGYHEFDCDDGKKPLRHSLFYDDAIGNYYSYNHMIGHIMGSYCCSPYAFDKQKVAVITSDGGQNARLHIVDPNAKDKVFCVGSLHQLSGLTYAIMGVYFGPFKNEGVRSGVTDVSFGNIYPFLSYDVPGKLMSFIALGDPKPEAVSFLHATYRKLELEWNAETPWASRMADPRRTIKFGHDGLFLEFPPGDIFKIELKLMRALVDFAATQGYSDADCLASIHLFLEELLVIRLKNNLPNDVPVINTGGTALNIKFNTALREAGYEVWVPPFPNDAGSSLGTACAHMVAKYDHWVLDWSVYAGPRVVDNGEECAGWTAVPAGPKEIAEWLAAHDEDPMVVLYGRAEIGPRALGHRSLLTSARNPKNKDRLNHFKKRESWRPVAPICMEDQSERIFNPGTRDPYMLFDHFVRDEYLDVYPAIVHVDKTARLQTVSAEDDTFTYSVLKEYFKLTGHPVLCNTSANLNGHGFFPDAKSAMNWAEQQNVKAVFVENKLYTRK